MKIRTEFVRVVSVLVVLALLAFQGLTPIVGQEQDEDVRGAFLTTRPNTAEKSSPGSTPTKRSRRRPKTPPSKPNGDAVVPPGSVAKPDDHKPRVRTPKLGLGLTLFARDANGLAVRVDPARVFRSGDRVRALLETNADGYLYVFNTTDGGKPVMIYPNPELDEGGNYIQSHVPFELPATVAEQERLRWLTFDKYAGTERLFFVFTREPLPAVPTEDDLINFCRDNEQKCPLEPASELWAQIQSEMSAPLQVARADKFGKSQTAAEQVASTRGLGLSKEDPEPSLVMMATSPNTHLLVAMLELIHK